LISFTNIRLVDVMFRIASNFITMFEKYRKEILLLKLSKNLLCRLEIFTIFEYLYAFHVRNRTIDLEVTVRKEVPN